MEICGREYTVHHPRIVHTKDKRKAGNRVHVNGLNKANGDPIRFKSVQKAERHILNMRLAKD